MHCKIPEHNSKIKKTKKSYSKLLCIKLSDAREWHRITVLFVIRQPTQTYRMTIVYKEGVLLIVVICMTRHCIVVGNAKCAILAEQMKFGARLARWRYLACVVSNNLSISRTWLKKRIRHVCVLQVLPNRCHFGRYLKVLVRLKSFKQKSITY